MNLMSSILIRKGNTNHQPCSPSVQLRNLASHRPDGGGASAPGHLAGHRRRARGPRAAVVTDVPQLLYLNFVAAVLDNAGDTQFPHQPQPCTIPSPSSSAQCTNPMIDGSLGSRCRRQRAGRRERQRRVGRWELIMPHSVERHHGLGSRTRPLRDYRRESGIMASTATPYCSALFIVASTRTQLET